MLKPTDRRPSFSLRRGLVYELVKRDFSGRYRGTFGGALWSLEQPLFLLAVYTLAFGVILKARWGATGSTRDYAFMLFVGLIVFNAFSECLRRAPTLVTVNPNYVKKVVFPLEILPWVPAISAVIHALIAVAVWAAGYLTLYGLLKPTFFYFPLILAALFPILLGLGWLLAAAGVFVRDIDQLTALISHALLFLTPIFFSVDAVPPALRRVLLLNPLTFAVEQMRQVMFVGAAPDFLGLLIYLSIAAAFSLGARWFFQRLRPGFADAM
jgi:lipopolysaccharide transport system permease protein